MRADDYYYLRFAKCFHQIKYIKDFSVQRCSCRHSQSRIRFLFGFDWRYIEYGILLCTPPLVAV